MADATEGVKIVHCYGADVGDQGIQDERLGWAGGCACMELELLCFGVCLGEVEESILSISPLV